MTKTLAQLGDGMCKWIVAYKVGTLGEALYCGEPCVPRKPYCEAHRMESKKELKPARSNWRGTFTWRRPNR